MDAIDKQLLQIQTAEQKYKNDTPSLIEFWESLWSNVGLKFNGTKWTFRLVELYYKEKRYDGAWRMLDDFVLTKPEYITNTRKWQIKVLKKEEKDYSHIQQLLNSDH